jgi:branched-chain amino acid transport system substrate-binding protein
MQATRRAALALVLLAAAPFAAEAQVSDDVVRVGVLTDLSGPYADFAGPGSVVAARMAVEDHGGRALGKAIEVVGGDHQNKPDVGGALARRWVDIERVDMVIDMPNSAVALAVQQVGANATASSSTPPPLDGADGRQCSPVGFHWVSTATRSRTEPRAR